MRITPRKVCFGTVQIFYLGLSKYLGSGWLYQKSKDTLWSPTSRDLSDATVESPLNSARKKLQRPKLKKSQTVPWKWHFSPHDFLGLQQSLCNINFSFGIFISKYQRKNLLKCTTVIAESIKVVDFWWPLFWHFRTVNVIFVWNQLYQKNFTSFGNKMSKKFCNYLWRFWYTKRNAFAWSAIFFALNFI